MNFPSVLSITELSITELLKTKPLKTKSRKTNPNGFGTIARNSAGLTLFELLVVIIIVGIASTMIVVSPDWGDRRGHAKTEAKRLADLIRLVIDEGIIAGSDMGLELTTNGYRFLYYEYETESWRVLDSTESESAETDREFTDKEPTRESTDILRPRVLPETMNLDLISVDGATPSLVRMAFDPDDPPSPRILFLSTGEITPFRLSLIDGSATNGYGEEEYYIIGKWDGSISVTSPPNRPERVYRIDF